MYEQVQAEKTMLHAIVREKKELFMPYIVQRGNQIVNEVPVSSFVHTNANLLKIMAHNLIDTPISIQMAGSSEYLQPRMTTSSILSSPIAERGSRRISWNGSTHPATRTVTKRSVHKSKVITDWVF